MDRQKTQRMIAALALAAGGVLVGSNLPTTNVAHGEVRGTPEQPAFQKGDQLALPILRDISATLHQIDGRVARLESAAQKVQNSPSHGVAAPPVTEETETAQ
jgi:hypothetical protein